MHGKIGFVLLILEQEDGCTRTTCSAHTHNAHTTYYKWWLLHTNMKYLRCMLPISILGM